MSKSFSATESFTPSVYKITTYTLQFCETGSTLETCLNPFTVNAIDAGSQMDLGGVEAGQQAGSFGNLSLVPPGTVYTHGQVIFDRKLIISGFGTNCETGGTAGSKAAYGTSVTKTDPPTPVEQDIFIVTNTTNRTSAKVPVYTIPQQMELHLKMEQEPIQALDYTMWMITLLNLDGYFHHL